ncbi:MAG: thioesterase family protein [Desulfarculaceae bacterium]|nr:thioesterase family protein [Desulfarculaceae bacterium]MCF8072179.1 thioesterase family protein [Desulfarculaceae bacterium]MCF8100100.1 thioesterase family protein [Desulfarculaceae bacterium]MCF8117925.1 thioesterase family protein [Desulfarculaceae bacterium]
MRDTLRPGLKFIFEYEVPYNRTVPCLLPESREFQQMPRVLATGYMVGLFEWACIQAMNPHLDWPREQSVGIGVNLSHVAATPPGLTVTIEGELKAMEGKRLEFAVQGHDGVELISSGTHQRYVIDAERFNAKAGEKLAKAQAAQGQENRS